MTGYLREKPGKFSNTLLIENKSVFVQKLEEGFYESECGGHKTLEM